MMEFEGEGGGCKGEDKGMSTKTTEKLIVK